MVVVAITIHMRSPVFRFEAAGEAGIPFPTLASAIHYAPTHAEARIATSAEGVVLAEAVSYGPDLAWLLTNAGRDVEAFSGWLQVAS